MKRYLISTFFLVSGLAFAQETAVFSSPELGLEFEHPASWKIERTKTKDYVITMPLEGRADPAKLEIYGALFADTPEHWELVQLTITKQLRRDMVRQWREEILGVPMLLSRVSFDDKGQRKDILTGLIYSATGRKMLFNLTAPTDAYDDAEYQFRQALQSLRTASGKLPTAEDPTRVQDPTTYEKPPTSRPPKILITNDKPTEKPLVKGAVTHPAKAGGQDVILHVPTGWSVADGTDGVLILKHAAVPFEVKLTVSSTIDSPIPEAALVRASGASLGSFKTVISRQENNPKANKAGAQVVSIWRKGTGASGPVQSLEAYGLTAGNYWLFSLLHEGTLDAKAEAALKELVDGASVEMVQ
jgi:hypothetical protein